MRKTLLSALGILLLAILLPAKSQAQCFATISGVVINANTQQPVAGQSVHIDVPSSPNTSYGSFTNPNGFFSINVPVPCGTAEQATIFMVACGDTLIQDQWVAADSSYSLTFYTCDSNVVTPPDSCSGVVSVSSFPQGINLSYQIPGANQVHVVFSDNPNATFYWPASHTFADSGSYEVCVTAYIGQCVWDTCFTVHVDLFTGTDSCDVDGHVIAYGVNGIEFGWSGGNSLGLAPTSVVWDFGDGNSSNNYPYGGLYQYTAPGTYTACVTLTWGTGCTATDCETVTVGTSPLNICGWAVTVDNNNDTIPLDCGLAYLIAIDSSGQHTVVDTVSVTPNGYCFYGQAPGTYTVLIVPCDSLLMPTYLGNVLFWQDADTYTGWNTILLLPGQSVQGPGLIGGTVVWGDKAVGDPIEGIRVLLLDYEANPISFAVTDAEGYYSFEHLPYGTYRVYPEYPGITTYPGLVTLSAENPTVESANFGLTTEAIMGIEEMPVALAGVYPNPAVDQATLSLVSNESGSGTIQLIDLAGKTVASFPVTLSQGQQNLSIDVHTLRAGMYTLALTVRGQRLHTKLIKQ